MPSFRAKKSCRILYRFVKRRRIGQLEVLLVCSSSILVMALVDQVLRSRACCEKKIILFCPLSGRFRRDQRAEFAALFASLVENAMAGDFLKRSHSCVAAFMDESAPPFFLHLLFPVHHHRLS